MGKKGLDLDEKKDGFNNRETPQCKPVFLHKKKHSHAESVLILLIAFQFPDVLYYLIYILLLFP